MCFHTETQTVIVNAYVLKMCFHIYAHGAQKSWHSGCVSAKTWERACVSSWKYQNGKGTQLCFQLSFTILLGNAYVLKTCFFVFPQDWNPLLFFLLKLTRTAVFARNSSHFEIESQGNDMQREKPNFPKSHHNRQKKTTIFIAKKNTKDRT